jgi:hypothetical protein
MSAKHLAALAVVGWAGMYLVFCQLVLSQHRLEHQEALVEHHKAMAEIYAAKAAGNYTYTTVLPQEVINGY